MLDQYYLYPSCHVFDIYTFVFVAEIIRILICIRQVSVSESDSEEKYENKYDISDICPIYLHP
jgi:hypothetical protein